MDLTAIALRGLEGAQTRFENAAQRLTTAASPSAMPAGGDTVDLSSAAVGLLAAKNDFTLNLKAVETADRMERDALDLLA